jgi:hypothetical protein
MAAVCITRTAAGYEVARTFRSQAAAQRALNLLLEIPEAAFEPDLGPYGREPSADPPPVVSHVLAEAILRDNPDGPLIYPITRDEE